MYTLLGMTVVLYILFAIFRNLPDNFAGDNNYFRYMYRVLTLNFGKTTSDRDIFNLMVRALMFSLDLTLRSTVLVLIFGPLLSILSMKINFDKYLTLIFNSVPKYVLSISLQVVFGLYLKLLPIARYFTFRHTILPSIALALSHVILSSKILSNSILKIYSENYIKLAYSKGLNDREVFIKHVLPNALSPFVSYVGNAFISMLRGVMVIEKIFVIPGIGTLYLSSIENRDFNLMLSISILLICVSFFLISFFNGIQRYFNPKRDDRI